MQPDISLPFRSALLSLIILLMAISFSQLGLAQTLQSPTRLSVNAAGVGGNASSTNAALSPNGRYSAFRSSASNLVSSDTNLVADIFLRDSITNSLTRVSVGVGGTEANGESTLPSISYTSPDGFFAIAYESQATNLGLFSSTSPDTNTKKDIYFTLPSAGITERASIGIGGTVANGESREPSITVLSRPETVLIAFTSDATNLVGNDTNTFSDVFLATITLPISVQTFFSGGVSLVRASEGTGGVQSNGPSSKPALSGDGRYVAFQSSATNLFTVTGVPTASQIYLYDSVNRTTTLVSRTTTGVPGNGASSAPSISYSGNFITFLTEATNLVLDGQVAKPGALQVMRFNVATGLTERVNVNSAGLLSDTTTSTSASARISPDGRTVVFTDAGSNFSSDDTNGKTDTFLRDMESKNTVRMSNNTSGGSADDASFDAVSAGFSFTALNRNASFTSFATNLVIGDTEGRTDLFNVVTSLTAQTIARTIPLETPPDLNLANGRSFTVGMLELTRLPKKRASSKKVVTKVQYRTVATRTTAPKKDVRTKLSSRNLVTFKNLPPGNYSVAYRAESLRNGKITFKTKFSAPQQITVQ